MPLRLAECYAACGCNELLARLQSHAPNQRSLASALEEGGISIAAVAVASGASTSSAGSPGTTTPAAATKKRATRGKKESVAESMPVPEPPLSGEAESAGPRLALSFAAHSAFQTKTELRDLAPSVRAFFARFVCASPFDTRALHTFCSLLLLPWPFVVDPVTVMQHQLLAHSDDAEPNLLPFRLCLDASDNEVLAEKSAECSLFLTVQLGCVRIPLCHASSGRTRALHVCGVGAQVLALTDCSAFVA